eukprot:6116678-Pleurochrysis_carterae.AAC.1
MASLMSMDVAFDAQRGAQDSNKCWWTTGPQHLLLSYSPTGCRCPSPRAGARCTSKRRVHRRRSRDGAGS